MSEAIEALVRNMISAHDAQWQEGWSSQSDGWLSAGVSTLLIELLLRYAANDTARVETYVLMRKEYLRRAAMDQTRFKADLADFVIPLVEERGEAVLREAWKTLKGRLPKRKLVRAAVAAFREAGLPEDPWLYLEPQIDRYAAVFDLSLDGLIGRGKKFALKKLIQHYAKGDADAE